MFEISVYSEKVFDGRNWQTDYTPKHVITFVMWADNLMNNGAGFTCFLGFACFTVSASAKKC